MSINTLYSIIWFEIMTKFLPELIADCRNVCLLFAEMFSVRRKKKHLLKWCQTFSLETNSTYL